MSLFTIYFDGGTNGQNSKDTARGYGSWEITVSFAEKYQGSKKPKLGEMATFFMMGRLLATRGISEAFCTTQL